MNLSFGFGIGVQNVNIPDFNFMAELVPSEISDTLDRESEIRRALAEPIGSPRLRELAHGAAKIVIITEPSFPTESVLPAVLDELYTGGAKKENITLVIASQDGCTYTPEERKTICGSRAANEIKIINNDPNRTVTIGESTDGKKIRIFKEAAEADLRVLLGTISYSSFLGCTGGADALIPRCASASTLKSFASVIKDPNCRTGENDLNPVRLSIENYTQNVGTNFILNLVFGHGKKLIRCVTGDPVAAHRNGCMYLNAVFMKKLPLSADIVLVSAGGADADSTVEAMLTALDKASCAVKRNGAVIMISSCKDGFSDKRLMEMITNSETNEKLLKKSLKKISPSHEFCSILAKASNHSKLFLVSDMDKDTVEKCNFIHCKNAQWTFDDVLANTPGARVLAIPYGTSTLPVVPHASSD